MIHTGRKRPAEEPSESEPSEASRLTGEQWAPIAGVQQVVAYVEWRFEADMRNYLRSTPDTVRVKLYARACGGVVLILRVDGVKPVVTAAYVDRVLDEFGVSKTGVIRPPPECSPDEVRRAQREERHHLRKAAVARARAELNRTLREVLMSYNVATGDHDDDEVCS